MNLVSVIIPVYNRDTMVEATLKNVLDSCHRPIEFVLVDDGSTDDSLQILQRFKTEHESEHISVKIVSQENKGGSAARNAGLAISSGDYIQFLDSDDTIHSSKFTQQIAQMVEQNSDLSVCDFQQEFPDRTLAFRNENPLRKVIGGGSVGCASPLIESRLAKAFSWTENLPFCQDSDYNLKVILGARSISYLPETLFYHNRHGESGITNDRKRENRPMPYKQRLASLFFDGILNSKYGFSPKRIILMTYSFILMFLKKMKHQFGKSQKS